MQERSIFYLKRPKDLTTPITTLIHFFIVKTVNTLPQMTQKKGENTGDAAQNETCCSDE